jgi:hypothetical protein
MQAGYDIFRLCWQPTPDILAEGGKRTQSLVF